MTKNYCFCPKPGIVFPFVLRLFAFSLLLSAPFRALAQPCANDTIPPVAVCDEQTVVSIGVDDPNDCYGPAGFNNMPPALGNGQFAGVTWVKSVTFDDGSYDDCNNIRFTIRREQPYSDFVQNLNAIRGALPCDNSFPTFPSEFERAVSEQDSVKFYCGEVGTTQTLRLRAYQVDSSGNFMLNGSGNPIYGECLISVQVQDKIKPVSICPANVTVSCGNFDPTMTAYGFATSVDNCCLDTIINTSNSVFFDTILDTEKIVRTFRAIDCSGNSSQCTQRIVVNNYDAFVSGKVYLDTLDNCLYDSGEPLLANWVVKTTGLVTGRVYETLTDSLGEYTQLYDPLDTIVELTLAAPLNFGQACPSVYTVDVISCQATTQDIPVYLESRCPLLSVDITAPFLRRCFPNTYWVRACNLSDETVMDVHTEVALDPYMDFTDSSIPGASLGNNTYSFDIGDLEAGECMTFRIFFDLDCEAPLGYTHCTEAHIFPDTLCPVSAEWSGADLKLSGYCDGDSVRLTVTNIGNGDMDEPQEFVVVEDVIMYQAAPFQLDNGASQTIAVPANGATWRMETDEVPEHPWGGTEAVAVEGCGGLNTTGLVNMFPIGTPNPFESIDCQQNIGSFDPNDKQAFPTGYGSEHFVEAGTDIEYLIRFQNTGTDTAFTVVVLDTLSQYLDATAIRPGAASHAYEFAVLDDNVLRFRFGNILLPDSNVNEAASHGFVKFRATQKADNPSGTVIENRAAIYFDFNDPVLTNTVFHTIGDHFVLVKTDGHDPAFGRLLVYPNPSSGAVFFELPGQQLAGTFELSNKLGQIIRSERFSGGQYRFERKQLPAGVYFYKIITGEKQAFSGKIMLK